MNRSTVERIDEQCWHSGKLHLFSRTGKIDRSVEAHKGAALCVRWSSDGTGILTSKLLCTLCLSEYLLVVQQFVNGLTEWKNVSWGKKTYRWCNFSGGQDGTVKMWSRQGLLRSVLATLPSPSYSCAWNGQANKVCKYLNNKNNGKL